MSVLETILIFVAVPAAIYFAIGLFTMRSKFAGTPRYRPGQEWDYPPVWWSANPDGLTTRGPSTGVLPLSGDSKSLGGARGSW